MKRILFFMMAVFALVSCGNDEGEYNIIDLVPVEFRFDITNAAGESLIDKNSSAYDSVFIANTYIEFRGKVYKMNEDAAEEIQPSSRAFYDTFHGIRIIEQYKSATSRELVSLAAIGSFMSDYNWKSEEIKIHWGDNSEDEIVFSSEITWVKNGSPKFTRQHLFNGKDYTGTFQTPYSYMRLVKNSVKEN